MKRPAFLCPSSCPASSAAASAVSASVLPVLLLPLLAVLCAVLCAPAPAEAGPSYRRVLASDPATASWQDGISLTFQLDEARCRKAYGRSWAQECMARANGEPGRLVRGMQMTPHVDGEWRWTGWDTISFKPRTFLAPGTRYTVSLAKADLPAAIVPDRKELTWTSQPEAAMPGRESIWIDPSASEAHGISLPITFIWPQDTQAVEKSLRLETSRGLTLAQPRFAWNATRDSVVVSALVRRLSSQTGRVTLRLNSMPAYHLEEGRRSISQGKTLSHSFGVPGRNALFSFKNISLVKGHDKNFNIRYELVLQTTLRTKPEDVLRYLTVLKLPERAEPGADRATDWTRYTALAVQDVQDAEKLEPVLVSAPGESDTIRLALPLQAERCVLVVLDKKLASVSGIPLQKDVSTVLRAPQLEAELSFVLPSNLVSLAGSRKLALHSTGIDSIHWRARRIQPSFLALFAASHGFSAAPLEPWMEDVSLDAQTVSSEGTLPVTLQGEGRASFPVLSLQDMLPPSACGLYQLVLEGMRDGKKVASAEKMILLTNFGLTLKENTLGGRNVYVASLFSGTPVAGVRVQLLARNGTVISSVDTNAQGMAYLPPASGLSGELEPVAVIATSTGKDPDLCWLSLRDSSRVLDMSDFAIAGRHGSSTGLMASVFAERGLFLPGETLHFGIMVRRFDWHMLPPDLPLEVRLTDPLGRIVHKAALEGDPALTEASWKSSQHSPAGPYRLDVVLRTDKGEAPVIGSATVRVEEFEPDTLALQAHLESASGHTIPARGWIVTKPGSSPARAAVSLRTLYGDAAVAHAVQGRLVAEPARLSQLSIPGFAGYTFQDISLAAGEQRALRLADASTDTEGRALLELPADALRGTFRGTVQLEGFDAAGGRAVARQLSALFSPLEIIAGYKPVDAANTLAHLVQNSAAAISVLAVDNTLTPKKLENLTLTLSQRRYVNALVRDEQGEFRYDVSALTTPLETRTLTLDARGTKLSLPTRTPGDYELALTMPDGTALLTVPYTVAGRELILPDGTSSVPFAQGNLALELGKSEYEPGDTIVVRMNAPYAGTGLLTIERDSVIESVWFRAAAGESEQRIRIPKSFEGQGYVSVLFARTSNSENIYIKPHAWATVPFVCGIQHRTMGLKLSAPAEVMPGKTLDITISAPRRGRAVLYAVDEGVLSLTGYQTPDPLQDLLANRALDVKTWQLFDLLTPDFARLKGRLPAFGGDMATPGGRFLNPFRRRSEPPFARWIGVVNVSPEEKTFSLPIPAWLSGSIRIMAVGSSSEPRGFLSADAVSATCRVRGSLLLRPLLPLAASPGDRIEGAVAVANTVAGSGRAVPVNVRLTAADGLAFVRNGEKVKDFNTVLEIDENTEKTIAFDMVVGDKLGSAAVVFEANLLKPTPEQADRTFAKRSQSLSLRPLAPGRTTIQSGQVETGVPVVVNRSLYPMAADTRLTVSAAPLAAFRSLATRLQAYPFTCTEQTISRAFPWVSALLRPELADLLSAAPEVSSREQSEASHKAFDQAMAAIREGLDGNLLSLWPGAAPSDVTTVYAADFLLTLAEYGYGVPQDMRSRLLAGLESIVWRDPYSLADARIKAWACWVLMRSGRLMTQDVERLHAWLDSSAASAGSTHSWREDVTAVLLADCYAMLRLNRAASELMPERLAPVAQDGTHLLDTTCALALQAAILSRQHWQPAATREGSARLAEIFAELSERALSPHVSTMAMALTTRALATAVSEPSAAAKAVLTCEERDGEFPDQDRSMVLAGISELDAPGCRRFTVSAPAPGQQESGLVWNLAVTGYDKGKPATVANGLEVHRRYLNEQGQEVQEGAAVRAGDVLTVELSLRSARPMDNVALVDLLPGGLEPLLTQTDPLPSYVDRRERREDRMLFFVSTDTAMRLVTYKARAITAGTFTVPCVHAEAMYQPQISATTPGRSLHIIRR